MKPKYNKGDLVVLRTTFGGKIYQILGIADISKHDKKNPFNYLLEGGGNNDRGTRYDEGIKLAWLMNKFDIDYEKLIEGREYFWQMECDILLIRRTEPIQEIIIKLRKEIGNGI